jgi:hypothetical protein
MDTEYRSHYYRRHQGFFFPIALITAGVVWLLVNNGTIPVENLYRLIPFWPVLLILAGLSLFTRRIWWPLNALMWAAAGVLVVWVLTSGSAFLPRLSPLELKHETLRETPAQATSADVKLNLSIHPTTVHALSGSQDLLVADIYSVNGTTLDASGGTKKYVSLHESFTANSFVFNPRIDQWLEASSKPWDIGISPAIPVSLTVDSGTGRTDLNLEGLKLESLRVNAGTGRTEINLPKSQAVLPVRLEMGTGGTAVTLPADTPLELTANGGTGGLQINLPEGAGVQVDLRNGGLGGLTLPSSFSKVRGNVDQKEGVWQNAQYPSAKNPVKIILNIGTGGVTIQ